MRRRIVVRACAVAACAGALMWMGGLLASSGWGPALRSLADRLLPGEERVMWSPAPEPGAYTSSYADATGAGTNYVYLVQAADDEGRTREVQIISFGQASKGEGWLEITAKGGTGVRYRACEEADVPGQAFEALGGATRGDTL